jgi:serine/threonine protein kinase
VFRSGQKVGLYTLIEKLGRGGFGEVWLAEKRSQFVTKKVAVKLPHEEQVNFDAIGQEATLWEQASGHPNVLPIIDADVYDGQVVIVSEYADGGSLADKLKREEKLPLKLAVEMTIGILNGLDFLHNRKIIHRDIKPQNILLQGNTPRLADFGISRAMNTTIVSSAIIGTDAYMSPESFDGKRNAQTDIWSVGVVLYQLLKGSLPFPQEHPSERMFAVLTKEFAPLPDEIPTDLRRVVEKALQKQPENRYQTAEAMREDLERALIGIAHPTYAKTEVLIKPDFFEYDTNAPTIATGEQQTPQATNEQKFRIDIPAVENKTTSDETEIRTYVNQAPFAGSPQSNQPPPTMPSYEQNSVVTQYKAAQSVDGREFQMFGKPLKANGKLKTTSFEYVIAAIVGVIMVGGLIAIIFTTMSQYSASNSNYYNYDTPNYNSYSTNSTARTTNTTNSYSTNASNYNTNAMSNSYKSGNTTNATSAYSANSNTSYSSNANTRSYNSNSNGYYGNR